MSDELKELKALVRRFLKVTAWVPFRAVDLNCTKDECYELLEKLRAASQTAKKRSSAGK